MNLIYIDYPCNAHSNEVWDVLKNANNGRADMICWNELSKEAFLKELIDMCKNNQYDGMFSLDFLPDISLACGALNLKYISWISEEYSKQNYDYSIKNEWNILFVGDVNLCDFYKKNGAKHVCYLPPVYRLSSDTQVKYLDIPQINIWSDGVLHGNSIGDELTELKDSSKGYIDAITECLKVDLREYHIFDNLADYVKEDIESNYPCNSEGLMSRGTFYDHNYLFKHLDKSIAYFAISRIAVDEKYKSCLNLVTDKDYAKENIDVRFYTKNEMYEQLRSKDANLSINIVFPSLHESGNAFTSEVFNIVACGGYVLIPQYVGNGIAKDMGMDQFKSIEEMYLLVKNVMDNPSAAAEKASELKNKVLLHDSLSARIDQLICMLKNME